MFEEYLEFAVAASRDIDAPCDVAWKLLSNMSDLASVFSRVPRVERVDCRAKGGSDVATTHLSSESSREAPKAGIVPATTTTVGSKWRVHRHLQSGERYYSDWTVTRIDDGPEYPRSIVFFTTGLGKEGAMTSTSTWTVQPAREEDGRISPSRCRVTMTIAVIPHKLFVIVGRIVCCCIIKKKALLSTERDLDDLSDAAIAAKNETP